MNLLRINQFLIYSDIPLPCDRDMASRCGRDGEALRVIYAPRSLSSVPPYSHSTTGLVRYLIVEGGVLLGIEDYIVIHVDAAGTVITVDCAQEHKQEAALYVLGAALALCTALRGHIPLHAASVEVAERRFALVAPCGTGKSTTMWSFLEAGAKFATDDLTQVCINNGCAWAASAVSLYPKVGKELMLRDARNWSHCPEVLPERGKFWFPVDPRQRAIEAAPLAAVFALQPHAPCEFEEISIVREQGIKAISFLAQNSMVGNVVRHFLGPPRVMQNMAALSAIVPVYSIQYPKTFEALPFIVEQVRDLVSELSPSPLLQKI